MTRRLVLATLLLPGLFSCAHIRTGATRLEAQVKPVSYILELSVDPSQTTFSGREEIELDLSAAARRIELHGRGLVVNDASYAADAREPVFLEYKQLTPDGAAELVAERDLPAGHGILTIEWHAPFDTQVDGLYTAKEGGDSYAFTQFESIAARKMFPCFDEPAFKTPFDLTVWIPKEDEAISNTPILSARPADNGMREVHFVRTAPLPTYLLALMVGPFDIVNGPDIPATELRPHPIPLRGVAVRGKGKLFKYALAHAGAFVLGLEHYFGIPYPWEKLDLIAVPDFAAGAMENAGAITFREWLLLMEGDNAPAYQKRAFAGVTTHELAHQWFGDLVTMSWWDDIWLNEAFATWMAAQTLQRLDPTMNSEVDMINGMQGAMGADSLVAARRIRQPIETTDDILNAFDGITYSKGAGVIGMFEQWVGVEAFRRGVHDYLTAHRYGNGSTHAFLAAISKAAGRDVETPFRTFLDQPGVPIVDTRLVCPKDHPALEVRQARYRPMGSGIDPNETWQIPLCLRYRSDGKDRTSCMLVTDWRQTVPLEGKSCPEWLLPNRGGTGYYRFGVDPTEAKKLIDARARLDVPEQMSLIDSIKAGEGSDRLDIPTALSLLRPLADAPARYVANAPMDFYGFLRNEVATEVERLQVEMSAARIYKPVIARLARRLHVLTSEEQIFLHGVLDFDLNIGRDPVLLAEAAVVGLKRLGLVSAPMDPLFEASTQVDLSYQAAVSTGHAPVFDATVAKLRATKDPFTRVVLIGALAQARGALSEKARDLTLDPILRPSEMFQLLRPQAGAPETREETWAWVQQNIDQILARLPEGAAGALPNLFRSFCSDERADEVEKFFQPLIGKMTGGPRNLAGTLEAIHLCAVHAKAHGAAGMKALTMKVKN